VHLVRDALPDARGRALLRVVGVGNPWRSDDAAGLHAARALRKALPVGVEVLEEDGEPTALLDAFEDVDALWLVDAVSSGAAPGTVHRLDAGTQELPAELFRTSTHHLGLAEAVELGRVLRRLPAQVIVFGIEGAGFDPGDSLTAAVEQAVADVVTQVTEEIAACTKKR
jgi:hydrogenase maturation protease